MTTREERLKIASLISGGMERPVLDAPAEKPILQLPATPYYIAYNAKELRKRFPGAMLVREAARRLSLELCTYVTTRQLFGWLRREGYLISAYEEFNRPSVEVMEKGWMVCAKCGTTGNGVRYCTPYVTPSGYLAFLEIIRRKGGVE